MSENLQPLVYTREETRKMLRVGNTKLHQLMNSGQLEVVKFGSATRITARSTHALVDRQVQASGQGHAA